MTKKTFENIARIIGRLCANDCEGLTKNNLVNEFVSLFSDENPRFNSKKFLSYIESSEEFNNILTKARNK